MKYFLLFSAFLLNTSMLPAQDAFDRKSIGILPESKLKITGDTNIRDFACEFNTAYLEECKDIKFTTNESRIIFEDAVLRLKNKGFDCGNRAINKDFHDLIKSDKYPEISLRLNEIELLNDNLARAIVSIFIAGEKNNYKVPVEISQDPVPQFKGVLKLNIKDFELEAPRKMFGMIVVKDDIEIDFNLSVLN